MTAPDTTRTATCCCGQLRITASGEPVRVAVCHCTDCQRRTGSVFGVQARFHREQLSFAGQATTYVRTADSGNSVRMHFCPTCGSTLWYEVEHQGREIIGIAAGAFADASLPVPEFSIYEERMHPWVGLPDGIRHLP